MNNIEKLFKGEFVSDVKSLQRKLRNIRAFIFDWDGVFNNGHKSDAGSSSFSEVDAMGTNLMRFSNYLLHGAVPFTAIITGEQNATAISFGQREHFTSIYTGAKHKLNALQHFCRTNQLQSSEVAFVFDDVLDLPAADQCGLRIMISREVNPLLIKFARKKDAVDYLTNADGGNNGLREACELIMGLGGEFESALQHRIAFSPTYMDYLQRRDAVVPALFTGKDLELL